MPLRRPSLDHLSPSTVLSSAQRSSLPAVSSTRESGPSPATRRPLPSVPSTEVRGDRSLVLVLALACVVCLANHPGPRATGDCNPLAKDSVAKVLDLEEQ